MGDQHLALQAKLENDMEYQAIVKDHHCAEIKLRKLMDELNPAQQGIIHEYLGTLAEMQMREIELALMV